MRTTPFLLLLILSSCCDKITRVSTYSETVDTTKTVDVVEDSVAIHVNMESKIRVDSLEKLLKQERNKPRDSVRVPVTVFRETKGGFSHSVDLLRDSLGDLHLLFESNIDSLLADKDSLERLTIRLSKQKETTITIEKCPAGIPRWLHLPLIILALFGAASVGIWIYKQTHK